MSRFFEKTVVFSLFVLICGMPDVLRASDVLDEDMHQALTRRSHVPAEPLTITSRQSFPLITQSRKISVKLRGTHAQVTVETVFKNPSPQVREGTWMFPVPAEAAITQLSLRQNGQHLEGELLNAETAREIYRKIARSMKDPALLEWSGERMIRAKIFPIAGGQSARLTYHWVQPVVNESGTLRFRHPLGVPGCSSSTVGSLSMNVEIDSPTDLKAIFSTTHRVAVDRKGDRQATVSWELDQARPRGEFVLHVGLSPDPVGATLLTHQSPGEDPYFMLVAAPNSEVPDTPSPAKDVLFVMDTSGSMAGEKMTQARGALEYCLNSLQDGDRFNLVSFSSESRPVFDRLKEVGKDSRAEALSVVTGLQAAGGTNILEALKTTLAMLPQEGVRPSYVIFLTDGLPTVGETNVGNILKKAQKMNPGARVFSFGVGHDVNTDLIDRLAIDHRGSQRYVMPGEDIEEAISELYSKIRHPVMTHLTLTCTEGRIQYQSPQDLQDLFHGSQLMVFGRFNGDVSSLKLSGRIGDRTHEIVLERGLTLTEANGFIPRLWARRRVGWLLEQIRFNGSSRELVDEVRQLGKRYGIVTPFTAYLAVEDGALSDTQAEVRRGFRRLEEQFEKERRGRNANEDSRELKKLSGRSPDPGDLDEMKDQEDEESNGYLRNALKEARQDRALDGRARADVIRQLGSLTFYAGSDGVFKDSRLPVGAKPIKTIQAYTDVWFEFFESHPEFHRALMLERTLWLWVDGDVVRIETP